MTAWEFLFVVLVVALTALGCFCWGWQMGVDDMRRIDDEKAARDPLGWLPLHVVPPGDPRRREAMRQHPAGGRQ